jgi:hypothetical protein
MQGAADGWTECAVERLAFDRFFEAKAKRVGVAEDGGVMAPPLMGPRKDVQCTMIKREPKFHRPKHQRTSTAPGQVVEANVGAV